MIYVGGSTAETRFNTVYLFRPTTPQGAVLHAPFSSSSAEARLKVYLQQMGCDSGKTLHGFRAGCAITLALSGAKLSEIMDHVGWSRRHTVLYYLQLAKVLNPTGALGRLAEANVLSVIPEWEVLNNLRRFVCSFPADTSMKRPRRDYFFFAIHSTREQSAKSRTSCKCSGDTRYAHSMVDVSQEVTINSGKHSYSTYSQISAKDEAGTAHPPHPFAENSWGS